MRLFEGFNLSCLDNSFSSTINICRFSLTAMIQLHQLDSNNFRHHYQVRGEWMQCRDHQQEEDLASA